MPPSLPQRLLRRARPRARTAFGSRLAFPPEADDLRAVPSSWTTGPPDFVGVGFPKAGTTWWQATIERHPKVVPNRFGRKESQFFCVPWLKDDADRAQLYREAFGRPTGGLSGEWTPNYITYPFALERLRAAAPSARLLVTLRNPIDRTASHLNHLRHQLVGLGLQTPGLDFMWRYTCFPEAIAASFAADHMRRLLDLVPRDQLLVLQYEKLAKEPRAELARTFAFLGVDDADIDVTRRVNERPYLIPRLEPGERRVLSEHFRADVSELAALVPDLDVELWTDFATYD